jgi:hypothetical protein
MRTVMVPRHVMEEGLPALYTFLRRRGIRLRADGSPEAPCLVVQWPDGPYGPVWSVSQGGPAHIDLDQLDWKTIAPR